MTGPRPFHQDHLQKLEHPHQLNEWAVIVIGLWRMGVHKVNQMCDIMRFIPYAPKPGLRPSDLATYAAGTSRRRRQRQLFAKYAWRVLNSRHPVIIEGFMRGLPRSCAVMLPQGASARCGSCHGKCDYVPCVKCGRQTHKLHAPPVDASDVPLLPATRPTTARPGTPEKIEVMRQRLERGESVFHAADERLSECYHAWELPHCQLPPGCQIETEEMSC